MFKHPLNGFFVFCNPTYEFTNWTIVMQISAFGSADSSDTGDIWILEWDKSKSTWEQDQPVKFKHQDTGTYLSSHSKKFNRPITGQQEVCAKAKSKDANWLATEGVFFPSQAQ